MLTTRNLEKGVKKSCLTARFFLIKYIELKHFKPNSLLTSHIFY